MAKKNDNQAPEKLKDIETEEAAETVSSVSEDTEKLNEEIEKLKKEISDMNDKYLRLVAEYDNFRKRSQKEKDAIYPEAVASTVEKFLPLSDNFERAMSFECKDEEFKKGMEMIETSLGEIFKSLKVETIGEVGEAFDPNVHNAVMHEENEDFEENSVMEVLQKGFKIGDKVIRCAMVKVAN